ncbi:MAG: glycoside hydrolase family 172 protein, partial [Planctomycetota bacterium]
MEPSICFLFAVLVVAAAGLSQDRYDLVSALRAMQDDTWISRPPRTGERTVQWSSFDRRSLEGPGQYEAWFSNDDRGKYLAVEQGQAGAEHVMCETLGKGVITRIWSANPSGTLFVDLDGERVWVVDFAQLCSGAVEGLSEPYCGMRARGGNCYLPMPFSKSAKVSASSGDLYYHVDVLQLPSETEVTTFAPAQIEAAKPQLAATAAVLAEPRRGFSSDPGLGGSIQIEAGRVVTWFAVAVPEPKVGEDLGQLLRQFLLVVRCGKEETVRVPLLDFFAGGADWRPHSGHYLHIAADRTAHCSFRMPMPLGGSIRIVPRGLVDGWTPTILGLGFGAERANADDLLFRASFHSRQAFPTRPFHDHLVLDANGGAGRFVGCSLLVKNPHRAWWGEGDEKFYVDGEAFPSTFGTGTEDYFGYAWCEPSIFQSALHGQVQCDGPMNYGFTAVHRVHLLDMVPFQKSFRFDLEVWHWVPDLQMDYASVAYWYGEQGATSGLPPVPSADGLALRRLPQPKVLRVQGALEAEQLRVLSCSGGTTSVQETWFVEELCSQDAQL